MASRSLIVLPLLLLACHAVADPGCPGGADCAPRLNEKSKPYSKRPQSPEAQAARRLSASIEEARSLFDRNDPAGSAGILDGVMRDPGFEVLPAKDRRLAWSVLARIDMSAQRSDRAIERLKRAIAVDDSDPDVWYWLATSQYDRGQHEAAAKSFTELAERWPELLGNIDSSVVYHLQAGLRDGSQEKVDFLQMLFDARWDDPAGDASVLWHRLALMRLDRGEVDAARAVIRRIEHPDVIIAMRSDKRFDSLIDRDAWAFNPQRAAQRAVETMRAKVDGRPEDLDAKVQFTYALLDASDHEGTIRFVDAVLAASPSKAAGDMPAFDMAAQADAHAWLLNNRAVALYRLGRTQEALADMERARRLPEGDDPNGSGPSVRGPNVNQTLNLGEFYCTLGRAADAARMADAMDAGQASEYGRLFQARVRLCAAWLSQDEGGMRRAYATIRKGRSHGESIHLEALLMLGRLDEAAEAMIRLLDSPGERVDTLAMVQRYREVAPTPVLERLRARREALLARDDVKAAIARVGHREAYDMYSGAGFD